VLPKSAFTHKVPFFESWLQNIRKFSNFDLLVGTRASGGELFAKSSAKNFNLGFKKMFPLERCEHGGRSKLLRER